MKKRLLVIGLLTMVCAVLLSGCSVVTDIEPPEKTLVEYEPQNGMALSQMSNTELLQRIDYYHAKIESTRVISDGSLYYTNLINIYQNQLRINQWAKQHGYPEIDW